MGASMRLLLKHIPLLLLGALSVACGSNAASEIGPPPSGGAFGNASVRPECGAFSQACLESGMDAPLAVGAAMGIGVDYNIAGNSGPDLTLEPANPGVLGVEGAVIIGENAGSSSLLILGPESEVVDFIHVWVAEASELRIVRHNDDGGVIGNVASEGTVLVGDDIVVSVEAFTTTQALMGVFDTTFEIEVVEGDEPVAIVEDIVFGWYRIVARSEGQVRVIATALDQTRELELEVLP